MKTLLFGEPVEFERYADGRVYFKLKDIVVGLGLDWATQLQKITRNVHDRYSTVSERFIASDGKQYQAVAIDADSVGAFLEDINVNRCSKDVAYRVLTLREKLQGLNVAEEAFLHSIQ